MGSYPFMDNAPTRYQALLACRDKAGSVSKMGRDLGIPQSTMSRIINSAKQLPAEYVIAAERLYGVSRHFLRPDIYPIEPRSSSTPMKAVDQSAARVCFNRRSKMQVPA